MSTDLSVTLEYLHQPIAVVEFPALLPVGTEIEIQRKRLKIQRYRVAVPKNDRRSLRNQVSSITAVMERA